MVNRFTLPRIEAGVSGNDAIEALNAPIDATEKALNYLVSQLGGINNKSAIIRQQVPIASTVSAGMLVYYDTEEARFKPALAALLPTPGYQGASIEAPSSRVEGMIIATDNAQNTGTLLQGGFYMSIACVDACLGPNAVSGTYYLSPVDAGKATKDPGGHLRQPLITYYGDGKFSMSLFYMAHDNHFHASVKLRAAGWGAVPTEDSAPVEYLYKYSRSVDEFANLGELDETITAIFYDGKLETLETSIFAIKDGELYATSALVTSKPVVVFNHYPFAYGAPVVRSIRSTNTDLTVKNRNGSVELTFADWEEDTIANKSMKAVSGIEGKKISFTPVVSDIISGPGITVGRGGDGSVTISTSGLVGSHIDAYSMNFNGSVQANDGEFTYITFPAGRNAGLDISLPINGVDGSELKARVWAVFEGKYSEVAVSMKFVPMPSVDEVVGKPSSNTTSKLSNSGEDNKFSYAETTSAIDVKSNGLLLASLSAKPSADIRMLRVGFILTVNNATEA